MSQYTRRSIPALLAGLVGSTTTLASAQVADPIFAALDAYAQARADWSIASDHLEALEQAHREAALYKPKAQIGTFTEFDNGSWARDVPIYGYSLEDIENWAFPGAKARAIAEFTNDKERHEARMRSTGLTGAKDAEEAMSDRYYLAEVAVLETVPTTMTGALALAQFAAHALDDRGAGDDTVAPLRGLFAFLTQAACA